MRPYTFLLFLLLPFASTAQAPYFNWALHLPGNGNHQTYSIDVDPAGNTLWAINFFDSLDADPGPGVVQYVSSGLMDFALVKTDPAGNYLWSAKFGTNTDERIMHITTDAAGNVYCTGGFASTLDFDPGPGVFNLTSGLGVCFLFKLTPAGNLAWAKIIGEGGASEGAALTTDPTGNIYLTGFFQFNSDFDPGPATFMMNTANMNTFVCKLDSAGNFGWAKYFSGPFYNRPRDITVDMAGNVLTTGEFYAATDFDPGAGTASLVPSLQDIFISKLDPSGNYLWAGKMGGSATDISYSIRTDNAGNIITSGSFASTADFDPGPATFNLGPGSRGFLSKLSPAGAFIFAREFGNGGARDMDQADDGTFVVTGTLQATGDFDPGTGTANFTALGTGAAFAARYDANGDYLWAGVFNTQGNSGGSAITAAPNGEVFVGGTFTFQTDMDPGPGTFNLFPTGTYDPFLVKISDCIATASSISPVACDFYLSPSGNHLWTASGSYQDTLQNAAGCDSILSIALTVTITDTVVTQSGSVLTSSASGATYQWMDCTTMQPVAGQTGVNFNAASGGTFACIVTQAGCTDTSGCHTVNPTATEPPATTEDFYLFPNPTTGTLFIRMEAAHEKFSLSVTDLAGRTLIQKSCPGKGLFSIDLPSADGWYMVCIQTPDAPPSWHKIKVTR